MGLGSNTLDDWKHSRRELSEGSPPPAVHEVTILGLFFSYSFPASRFTLVTLFFPIFELMSTGNIHDVNFPTDLPHTTAVREREFFLFSSKSFYTYHTISFSIFGFGSNTLDDWKHSR